MRNLKKILAVITVVAMLATLSVVPALAAGFTYETEAETLNELKLMEGMNLGDPVTRIVGLTLAIKAAGLKDEVDAMTDEEVAEILENVVDADELPAWSLKWTAYAVENGYTSGTDATIAPKVKFSADQTASSNEVLYWVLKIGMGYEDVVPGTANTDAINAGALSLAQAIDFGTEKNPITRDDVAGILYQACESGVNADGVSFIQSLIDAGFITEDAAADAGFVEAAPEVLEVVSVSTTNLKQLVVEFNSEIEEAGDEDNYSIETDGDAVIDEDSAFDLQDDNKTVVITLTTDAAQQEVVDLTIKDIKAESGAKFEETTIEDIELFDNTIPSAVSASVVGKYTIKVVFSEPIGEVDEDGFDVDGGDILIDTIEKLNNDTEVNVTLYSALEEGTIEIEAASSIKDYAGFGIPKKAFTLDIAPDETAPVVVGYKDAKPAEVTLIFDEDIVLNEEADEAGDYDVEFLENFYHTNTKNFASDLSASGKELTLKFDDDTKLPEGRAYVYIEKESLQDLWENENGSISYTIEVTLDTEPPVLEKAEQGDDEQTLKLTFSEELDAETAETTDNYTVLDEDGKVVEDVISSATLGGDDNDEVTIIFDDDQSGDFSIVVEKVEDLAGNAMSKTTKAYTMDDSTAPLFTEFTAKIYNAGVEDQLLKVKFEDTMAIEGAYSVLDLNKYEVAGENLSDIDNVKIKAVDNNKAVEITIPSLEDDEDDGFDVAPLDILKVARVADAAGNKTEGLVSQDITIADEDVVELKSAELTSTNTVVVTLKDRLATFKSADFKDSLYRATTDVAVTVSRIKHTVNSDGESVVTLTLADDYGTEVADLMFATDETASENIYGETLDDAIDVAVDDKAAPTVDKVEFYSDTVIKVTLTEAIDGATFLDGAKNGFSVSGGDAELDSVTLDGVVITLTGEDFKVSTNVYYNDVFGLADAADNALESFSRTDSLDEVD